MNTYKPFPHVACCRFLCYADYWQENNGFTQAVILSSHLWEYHHTFIDVCLSKIILSQNKGSQNIWCYIAEEILVNVKCLKKYYFRLGFISNINEKASYIAFHRLTVYYNIVCNTPDYEVATLIPSYHRLHRFLYACCQLLRGCRTSP